MKTIYLAGGCFWGTQKFFDQFEGVSETETGYANGPDRALSYQEVCRNSGHAETVRIVYDESRISLTELLKYYFMVIDPLSVNRQGHDTGIQYRTGIYYTDPSQLPEIEAVYRAEEEKAGAKLAVELLPLQNFFPAEEYHQKYLDKNPGGYCHIPGSYLHLKQAEKPRLRWCAIGDSFTYLNDHLDETGHRVTRGYLDRIHDQLSGLVLRNIGINGSTFRDWIDQEIPEADLYTVLLGTNDWHQGYPLGTEASFRGRQAGTILGHLGILLDHIRAANPKAMILAGNPVERADFVYLFDPENNAPGSYAPEHGQRLSDVASAILACCALEGVPTVNCHDLSGFTQDRLIRFKRVTRENGTEDLPYPDYIGIPFTPGRDVYPYPPEAAALTYDGLHPTDEGCQILADLFAAEIRKLIG